MSNLPSIEGCATLMLMKIDGQHGPAVIDQFSNWDEKCWVKTEL